MFFLNVSKLFFRLARKKTVALKYFCSFSKGQPICHCGQNKKLLNLKLLLVIMNDVKAIKDKMKDLYFKSSFWEICTFDIK